MLETITPGLQHSLGPAVVVEATPGRLLLEMPTRRAWAQVALAYPYAPQKGDVVLAIGDDDVFVIGVLSAQGQTRLEFAGDVRLRASGRLSIEAGQEVCVAAPSMRLSAGRLEIVAHKMVEKLFDSLRWVKNTLRINTKRQRVCVDEESTLRAGRIAHTASGDVKIDGKQIKLG